MSDFSNVVPEWDGVPEASAEPKDAFVEHAATPEEVDAALDAQEADEDEEDTDERLELDESDESDESADESDDDTEEE